MLLLKVPGFVTTNTDGDVPMSTQTYLVLPCLRTLKREVPQHQIFCYFTVTNVETQFLTAVSGSPDFSTVIPPPVPEKTIFIMLGLWR